MKFERDQMIFESTGLSLYANNGIIGLSPDLEVSEGYDGGFNKGIDDKTFSTIPFTEQERDELADYMISLWQEFKQQ